jgi:hypothetical protein
LEAWSDFNVVERPNIEIIPACYYSGRLWSLMFTLTWRAKPEVGSFVKHTSHKAADEEFLGTFYNFTINFNILSMPVATSQRQSIFRYTVKFNMVDGKPEALYNF